MRIISGEARGRRLFAPQGMNTRPTADRVRESVFNILGRRVVGARVLDLFAGSGALALEAVSRGAEHAVLVDQDRSAAAVIEKNIALMRCADRTMVLNMDWRRALGKLEGRGFSLVFMDPPYKMEESYGQAACALGERQMLEPDAVLVMEHSRSLSLQGRLGRGFEIFDTRVYGDSAVSFARQTEEETE
jgi:16S rRNA (guanine966-N2)-methyltransferase